MAQDGEHRTIEMRPAGGDSDRPWRSAGSILGFLQHPIFRRLLLPAILLVLGIKALLTLSFTWDHRAFDGAPAAEFSAAVRDRLEGWGQHP